MITRSLRFLIGTSLALCAISVSVAQDEVDSSDILDGFGITPGEVSQLERGKVLAFSDGEFENTKRELSADAMLLVKVDLDVVLESLRETKTIIPDKVIIDGADVTSEADFDGVHFSEKEFAEVERLFAAKPGKDLNFSDSEYALLREQLRPHRNSDRGAKIAAASDAMRAVLIGRYNEYMARGLDGIAGYERARSKRVNVGRELQLTTDAAKPFEDKFPEFVRTMVGFPQGSECCEQHFRWLKVRMKKRYGFALSHTMIQKTDEFVLLTERQYYVSNTLNSVQVTLVWLPHTEGGYLGLAMSASADILDSAMGRLLRPLGRNMAKDLVSDVMREIAVDLESLGASPGAEN